MAGDLWARIPGHWKYVVGLFLGAKIVVTVAALFGLHAFEGIFFLLPPDYQDRFDGYRPDHPARQSLAMWFVWDSLHYRQIVEADFFGTGRVADLHFAFPPLYPLLGRALAPLLGGQVAWTMLIISNVAFLLMLYYAYRLAERLWDDRDGARRFARYLVLMPTAFILQAPLTESLFLCLALACFYYAECRKWLLVGALGFVAALSRSVGFLLVFPLALVLLEQGRYRLDPRALWEYVRIGWPLVLVPGGWLLFMAWARVRTGDWLRYNHLQLKGWNLTVESPVQWLWSGLRDPDQGNVMRAGFALVCLFLMIVATRYIPPAYVAYGLIFVLVPLTIGGEANAAYRSVLRYLLVVFPIALLLARWARRVGVDTHLTAALALLQGVLLVIWVNMWTVFIV